jgi:hypothetical protein
MVMSKDHTIDDRARFTHAVQGAPRREAHSRTQEQSWHFGFRDSSPNGTASRCYPFVKTVQADMLSSSDGLFTLCFSKSML